MNTVANVSIEAATATQQRVKARETFSMMPALLPLVRVEEADKGTKKHRFVLSAQGFPGRVTIWGQHAAAMAEAFANAQRNASGMPLLPVFLTATQSEARVIEGETLPGYYNLTAEPFAAITSNPFA